MVGYVAAVDDDAHAHVQQEFKKEDGHGHFAFGFDATNGIGASEAGDQSDVHGEYHFVTKEGVPVKVTYTADANGFHPQGDVLPTAPPVPEAIRKSLEYIKSHPSHDKQDKTHGKH